MSDEINAGGVISDDDLLTIIGNPGDYSAEVIDGARLEAQLRGLIGRFDDEEYKIVRPDGGERLHLDVVTLKGLYLAGYLNRESPIFVASQNRWLPLAQVFDVSRWQATGEESLPRIPSGEPGTARPRRRQQTTLRDRDRGADFPTPQQAPLVPSGALPPTTYANTAASSTTLSGISNYSEYKGVGGWLALFIVWQVACRPVSACIGTANDFSQLYPTMGFITALIIALNFGTLAFGVLIGIGLLRNTDASIVELTKKYLLTQLGVAVLTVLLTAIADLPWFAKERAFSVALSSAFFATIYVGVWYQYFTKSKRVQATYLDEDDQAGTAFTTIGLGPKQP
jgi:hypothetical protein